MNQIKERTKKFKELILATQFFAIILISIPFLHFISPGDYPEALNYYFYSFLLLTLILLFFLAYFYYVFLNKKEEDICKYSLVLNILLLGLTAVLCTSVRMEGPFLEFIFILPVMTIAITYGLYGGLIAAGITGGYILVSDFIFYGSLNIPFFDFYIIYIGILFLTAWLTGKFTDLENKTRQELLELNKSLEESEKKYDILLNGTSDIAVLCEVVNNSNPQLKVIKSNVNFDKFIGYLNPHREKNIEVVGKNIQDLLPEQSARTILELADRVMKNKKEVHFEYDYNNTFLDIKIIPITDDKGECTHFIITASDITHKKEMENYRLKIEKQESLSLLAGGIAHDFNNLLMVSMGNINLAKQKINLDIDKNQDNMEIFKLLEKTEKTLEQSKNLTNQLFTFAKGGNLDLKVTSIQDVLKEAAHFSLSGSNIKCHFNFPEDLSPVKIDKGQIFQVISNIVINACHAMPGGGAITIKAENVNICENSTLPIEKDEYVKISLKDQGIGIPSEYQNKIFDPYFSTKEEGSGLGLATCHSIIVKHGGYITLESEPGKGTTFHIYLKSSPEDIKEENNETNDETLKETKKILVMDDNEMIRQTLKETLESLDFCVKCAKDGDEAVELFKKSIDEEPIDIVILDLTVPGGKSGKDAAKEIKEIDPETKNVVMTGYSEDEVLTNYKDYGFDEIITKPFNMEEIKQLLTNTQLTSSPPVHFRLTKGGFGARFQGVYPVIRHPSIFKIF